MIRRLLKPLLIIFFLSLSLTVSKAEDEFEKRYKEAKRQLQLILEQNEENNRKGLSHLNHYIFSDDPAVYEYLILKSSDPTRIEILEAFYGKIEEANNALALFASTSKTPIYIYITGIFAQKISEQIMDLGSIDLLDSDSKNSENTIKELSSLLQNEFNGTEEQQTESFKKLVGRLHSEMCRELSDKKYGACYTSSVEIVGTESMKVYHYLDWKFTATPIQYSCFTGDKDLEFTAQRLIDIASGGYKCGVDLAGECSQSADHTKLNEETKTVREGKMGGDVGNIAKIINGDQSAHIRFINKTGGILPKTDDKELALLEERLDLLQKESEINLQVVFCELEYTLPCPSIGAFADGVWEKSVVINNSVEKSVLILVPYYINKVESALKIFSNYASVEEYTYTAVRISGSGFSEDEKNGIREAFYRKKEEGSTSTEGDFKKRIEEVYKAIPKPLKIYYYICRVDGQVLLVVTQKDRISGYDKMYDAYIYYHKGFDQLYSVSNANNLQTFKRIKNDIQKEQFLNGIIYSKFPLKSTFEENILNYEKVNCTLKEDYINRYHSQWVYSTLKRFDGYFADDFPAKNKEEIPSEAFKPTKVVDVVGMVLDVASIVLIPTGLDIVPDVLNGIYCTYKGEYVNATLNYAAILTVGNWSSLKNIVNIFTTGKNGSRLYSFTTEADLIQFLKTNFKFSDDLITKIKEVVKDEKTRELLFSDLADNTTLLASFEKNPALVEAWKVISKKPDLRKSIEALESVVNLKKNPAFARLGLTDELIADMLGWAWGKGIKNSAQASFEEVIQQMDVFGKALNDNKIGIDNFNKLISIFASESNKPNNINRQGAFWVMEDISNNASSLFKDKNIDLEFPVPKANGKSGRIDVKVDIPGESPLLIEYKWYGGSDKIPQDIFIDEFVLRDLFNINSLDKLQWRIKGNKLTKDDVKKYLSSTEGREALKGLGADKIATLVNDKSLLNKSKVEVVDAIISYLDNSNNFNKIFK